MKTIVVSLGKVFFRIRGLTPIPFYIACFFYSRIELIFFLTGFLLIGLGECLRIFSVGYLGISSRKTNYADAEKLVMSGPYRFVRNPIYLGNMLIYLGFTVLSNVFFPLFSLMTFVFFMFVYYSIALYEETVLMLQFDLRYQRYLLSVPRFFPLFRTNLQIDSAQEFDPAMALQSEKTTLIVLVLAFSAIVIKNYTL